MITHDRKRGILEIVKTNGKIAPFPFPAQELAGRASQTLQNWDA